MDPRWRGRFYERVRGRMMDERLFLLLLFPLMIITPAGRPPPSGLLALRGGGAFRVSRVIDGGPVSGGLNKHLVTP